MAAGRRAFDGLLLLALLLLREPGALRGGLCRRELRELLLVGRLGRLRLLELRLDRLLVDLELGDERTLLRTLALEPAAICASSSAVSSSSRAIAASSLAFAWSSSLRRRAAASGSPSRKIEASSSVPRFTYAETARRRAMALSPAISSRPAFTWAWSPEIRFSRAPSWFSASV